MGWLFLAALTNRWIVLVAVFTAALVFVLGGPLAAAVLGGALVAAGGAAVQAGLEWQAARRQRSIGYRPASARIKVRDAEAGALLNRAESAALLVRGSESALTDAPSDLVLDVRSQADRMLATLHDIGVQVDRLSNATASIDVPRLEREIALLRQRNHRESGASEELTQERRRAIRSLESQLATAQRLTERRAVLLARMRATAAELEGIAARLGELGAMYSSHGGLPGSDSDLRALTSDLDTLRLGLAEADDMIRRTLSDPGTLPPPDQS